MPVSKRLYRQPRCWNYFVKLIGYHDHELAASVQPIIIKTVSKMFNNLHCLAVEKLFQRTLPANIGMRNLSVNSLEYLCSTRYLANVIFDSSARFFYGYNTILSLSLSM